MIKKIAIFGSTGSIGQNALKVISNFPKKFKVTYLTANKSTEILERQIKKFSPKGVAVQNEKTYFELKKKFGKKLKLYFGETAFDEIIDDTTIDLVLNSIVGFAGLFPTVKALEKKKNVAIANKETLVVAGKIITEIVKKNNVNLIPIDSEHSAIFQCLIGEKNQSIKSLILTASGGPFLKLKENKFKSIKLKDALNHPIWKMGNKITIDSATMMNKGLEVIEAHWLFNISPKKIKVIIHPQSIVHSMVEFNDGSIKAQLGIPDMKIPIQYALTYPERFSNNFETPKFEKIGSLNFFEPDMKKFKCLQLAYDAIQIGGTSPVVLNAANEVATSLFLKEKISFIEIPNIIEHAILRHTSKQNPSLKEIEEIDLVTREKILSQYN